MECQHDLVFRNACGNEFFGNAAIDPIVVHPEFAIAEFGVKDEAMNPSFVLPSFVNYDEMIAVFTHKQAAGDAVGFAHHRSVLRKNFVQNFAVLI